MIFITSSGHPHNKRLYIEVIIFFFVIDNFYSGDTHT